MQQHIRKIAVPMVAAFMFALNGTANAVTPQQQTEKPVDCKKTPEHPRCKDKQY